MMETYIADFHTRFYILEIKQLAFHMSYYSFQGHITVSTHAMNHLNVLDHLKMCCVIVIIPIEQQLYFHTRFNMNTMVAIDMFILKAFYQIILVQQHRQKRLQHYHHINVMVCFTLFSYESKQYSDTTAVHSKHTI